ncbi:hypothetical protein RJT34_23196 [Clitoria ternatea]|uniref:Pectinesterase inhibitor domain-containing protein n=1 Tax=Clitoria ternatea TaxID=43366 RepID=A0AAN9IL09_CLITE
MDFRSNKSLTLIATLSSLLILTNAVPSSHLFSVSIDTFDDVDSSSPALAPAPAPVSTNTFQPDTPDVILHGSMLSQQARAHHIRKFIKPEILRFCIGTENPTLCAETIAPFLTGVFDPLKALSAEITATQQKANEVFSIINNMLNDPNTNKNAIDALGICKSQYADMMDAIKEAFDLVAQQNVVDAYYKFNAVISYKTSCDDAFQESPGVRMPFRVEALAVFQLGGNCLAIMDSIVNHHRM